MRKEYLCSIIMYRYSFLNCFFVVPYEVKVQTVPLKVQTVPEGL